MNEIPDNYYSILSSYEEFVIKTNLLGYDTSDEVVLKKLNQIEDYYWFIIDGHLCFIDRYGNKVENVIIKGNFYCDHNQLTSLKGCPKEVGGNFDCSHNKLTSLKGCPMEVGGGLDCSRNHLTSLEDCPKKVEGNFLCSDNKVKLTRPYKLICQIFYN